MGYGNNCIIFPRYCFSTQDYIEWLNDNYHNTDDDDEKIIPKWFYLHLLFCDDCKKHIEFVDNKCSNYRSRRLLVQCRYCQKDFKQINTRKSSCSNCCRLIERKLKTYTFDLKKLASVYIIKRRKQEYIIDDLVQKVENYIF